MNTYGTTTNMTNMERESNMLHIIIINYSLKTVLRKFKEQGKSAVTKELTKLHAV